MGDAVSLLLASFLPAFASENPPKASPAKSTPEGLLLLHKMQDGLGGAKKIAAIHDLDETIRPEAWDANDQRGYTVTSPRTNVLRIEHDGTATDFTLDSGTRLPAKTAGVSLADPTIRFRKKLSMGDGKRFQAFVSPPIQSSITAV